LFSATFPEFVKNLALTIAPDPIIITVKKQELALKNVLNMRIVCRDENDKFQALKKTLEVCADVGQIIVFVNRVELANMLLPDLIKIIKCSVLYGTNMEPSKRDETVQNFRVGQTTCLIASNVIARGLDVPSVNLVVNYELPLNGPDKKFNRESRNRNYDGETFMHRVGRTGRFGKKGCCINLVMHRDNSYYMLEEICKEYNLPMRDVDNDEQSIEQAVEKWVKADELVNK